MTDEEKNFIKKINIDKAINKTKFTIILIVVSILTYVIPIFLGVLDFGIFFEIISLIFLIISRNYMLKYDEVKAKKYIICFFIFNFTTIVLQNFSYLCNAKTENPTKCRKGNELKGFEKKMNLNRNCADEKRNEQKLFCDLKINP